MNGKILIAGIILAVILYSATAEMWVLAGLFGFFLIIGLIIYAYIAPQKNKKGDYND